MWNVSPGAGGAPVAIRPTAGISTVTGSKAHVLGGTGTMCARAVAAASSRSDATRIATTLGAQCGPRKRVSATAERAHVRDEIPERGAVVERARIGGHRGAVESGHERPVDV